MKKFSIFIMAAVLTVLGFGLMAAAADKNPFEKDVKEIKALNKQIEELQGKESPDQKTIDKISKKRDDKLSKMTKKAEVMTNKLQKTLEGLDKKITAAKDKGGDAAKLEEYYKKVQEKIEQVRKWSGVEEDSESKDSDKEDKKDDKKADKEDKKDDKSVDKEEEKDDKKDDKEDEKDSKKSKKSKKSKE